jgi:hypothetical protein
MPTRQRAVTPVPLPLESRVSTMYTAMNLADAYSIELPGEASKNPEVLARFIFSQLPIWMIGLMKVRDALVAGFGLKTAKHLRSIDTEKGENRVGLFKIYSRRQAEIILGEDDKHLDFRLSVLYSDTPSPLGKRRLILSTVVHCHNRLGRMYIFLIAPFHRLVVKSSLSHAARIGWPLAAGA